MSHSISKLIFFAGVYEVSEHTIRGTNRVVSRCLLTFQVHLVAVNTWLLAVEQSDDIRILS